MGMSREEVALEKARVLIVAGILPEKVALDEISRHLAILANPLSRRFSLQAPIGQIARPVQVIQPGRLEVLLGAFLTCVRHRLRW
jgi:hypothetical protein